jgi:hypothetical protein
MSVEEHVRKVHRTLKEVEAAQRKHHRALQAMLEECGEGCGLSPGQITTYGGGVPKSV